jgi:hypothetical protein
LPFLFIFNTDLLLIDVDLLHGTFVFITATLAMLLFAAATQGWFLTRTRYWEAAALLLIAFTIFRPGFWMDMISPPFVERDPSEIAMAAQNTPAGEPLRLRIRGLNDVGDMKEWVVLLPLEDAASGEEKLENAGLLLRTEGDKTLVDDAAFGSAAKEAGLDWDQEIVHVLRPADQPSKYLMYLPALALLALVVFLQRRRVAKDMGKAQAA